MCTEEDFSSQRSHDILKGHIAQEIARVFTINLTQVESIAISVLILHFLSK